MPPKRLGRRAIFMLSFVTAGFAIVGWRFWDLQVLHGAHYQALAQQDQLRQIPIPAPRGNIVTANGVTVATSKPAWTLYYLSQGSTLPAPELNRLAQYLSIPAKTINQNILAQLKVQPSYDPIEIDASLTPKQITVIDENINSLPYLRIQPTAIRSYPYGSIMGNILGFLDENTATTDKGVYGLEQQYNSYLVGHSGGEYAEVNRQGQLVKLFGQEVPTPGDTLHLTINWTLEKTAYSALGYVMHIMQHANPALTAYAPSANQGGVIALNPNNGDILAIASLPSYNPNKLVPNNPGRTAYLDQLDKDAEKTGNSPFTIVPINDPFPPGSTFKPMMAVAALASHVVTATTEIYDPGYFPKIPSFHSWEYPNAFGWLNIEQAIGLSDDTFFYTLGYDMGINVMDHWMKQFLLNKPTGVDLPYAVTNTIPTPQELEQTQHVPWTPGQNLNTVIGQGLDDFTMITLARADAAIANGGTLYEPHLVSEITSPSGKVVKQFKPVVQGRIRVPASVWNIVHKGMELSAQDPNIAHTGTSGTGYGALAGFPIPLASKTGTAQVNGKQNNAVFLTYGPMYGAHPHPTILIMVYVKGGNWGADSGFVARAIYDQYFKVKDPSAKSLLDYTYGEPFNWPYGYQAPASKGP
jgi:penicillin-binding protein 2